MFKVVRVIMCDICGATDPAREISDGRGDTYPGVPANWAASTANREVHFCPRCIEKLGRVSVVPGPCTR